MNWKVLLSLITVAALTSCSEPDFKDINVNELIQNCRTEISANKQFKSTNVEQIKILAWYRDRDDRPHFVDCALCWAKVNTELGQKWVVVQMARNPMKKLSPDLQNWHSYYVDDAKNDWFLFFQSVPRNKDIYARFQSFNYAPLDGWIRYSSFLDRNAWLAAIGEPPERDLSSPSQKVAK